VPARKPPLSVEQILARADAHRARTGGWPGVACGTAGGAPGVAWRGIDQALRRGLRGLPAVALLLGWVPGGRPKRR
jgi:hypothetical protein